MIQLRDYQEKSVESLREGIRQGHVRQVLCAPTGSGKTVIAAHMIACALAKGSHSAFVCDRVALVRQTSQRLAEFGIEHGVAQGSNTFGRSLPVQVCSAQTLEKRGFWPNLDLIIVDEAHVQRKQTTKFILNSGKQTVGLTATPFSRGMGDTYTSITNVTTTNRLIDEGWIVPLKVYAAVEADMRNARTDNRGEWLSREVENRSAVIVGDIVTEWADKTQKHFGGPVKTLAFSATVAHGEQLCRAFQAAGFDFRQVSYLDKNDEARLETIQAFRDGEILGLVSCEALTKGFDVPDVLCGISARPYRKSLAAHIQQLGRVMRPSPSKDFALWLDHAGNYLGFLDDTLDFFDVGVNELDDGSRGEVIRKPKEKISEHLKCRKCGFVLVGAGDMCPGCGADRPRARARTSVAPGTMQEVTSSRSREWTSDQAFVWENIQRIATMHRSGDYGMARKFALAQYRNWFGEWPRTDFRMDEQLPDSRVEGRVRKQLQNYARRASYARAGKASQ